MSDHNHVPLGIGEKLRAAREAKGWSLSDLRRRLNLSEETLESLEQETFHKLPGASLTRGYLRMYCRALELPEHEIIRGFDSSGQVDPELSPPASLSGRTNQDGPNMGLFSILLLTAFAFGSGYWYLNFDAESHGPGEFNVIVPLSEMSESAESAAAIRTEAENRQQIAEQMTGNIAADIAALSAAESDKVISPGVDIPATDEEIDQSLETPPPQVASNEQILKATDLSQEPEAELAVGSEVTASAGVEGIDALRKEAISEANRSQLAAALKIQSNEKDLASLAADAKARVNSAQLAAQTQLLNNAVADKLSQDLATNSYASAAEKVGLAAATAAPIAAPQRKDLEALSSNISSGGNDVLALTSTEECWVEIKDSRGKRLMYGMLGASKTATLNGKAPFKVFLGNAPPARIAVNSISVNVPVPNNAKRTSRFLVSANGRVSRL